MGKFCKKTLGMTVCKVRSTIIKIPVVEKNSIPAIIYTSDDCTICDDVTRKLKRVNKTINNILDVKKVDIERVPSPNVVISLPTILIGNQPIIGQYFNEGTVLEAASNIFNKRGL